MITIAIEGDKIDIVSHEGSIYLDQVNDGEKVEISKVLIEAASILLKDLSDTESEQLVEILEDLT